MLTAAPASAQFDWGEWQEEWMVGEDDRVDCEIPTASDEPLNNKPWNVDTAGIEVAHQYNEGIRVDNGQPVKVAVIDSGVTALHPTFGDRVLEGADLFDADSQGRCDANGHGTGVAGIIAGGSEADSAYLGVAPQAEIIPIRIFQGPEAGDQTKSKMLAASILGAVEAEADVINVSIAVLETTELEQAVATAIEAGVIIVAATGNAAIWMDDEGVDADQRAYYPANYPGVIAVGGHNQSGNWYSETNFGENLDLLAPGVEIALPSPNGEDYRLASGTSFAAPHVAGAAALLVAEYPELATPQWVEQRLRDTAIPPPDDFNIYQGYGVLNIPNALTAPVGDDTATEEPFVEAEPSQIPAIDVGYDPLATEKTIAWASVGGAILLIVTVLVLRKVIPQGRRRGWRPGTRSSDRLPVKTADEGL